VLAFISGPLGERFISSHPYTDLFGDSFNILIRNGSIVSQKTAFIGAIPLVLAECYVVILFITKTFLLSQAETDVFDAVLLAKNHTTLVQKGRILSPSSGGGKVTKLGKAITKPISGKFSVDSAVRYVLSLPLNLIPVVGTVFFLGYNGGLQKIVFEVVVSFEG
jgi:hypothetical protein